MTDLDPDHHVEMSLRVLFDDIPDIVGLPRLLESPPCHKIFYFPDGSDRILVSFRQPINADPNSESDTPERR